MILTGMISSEIGGLRKEDIEGVTSTLKAHMSWGKTRRT